MASHAAGSVITPRFVLSEEYVFNSAVNTINNAGLNTPVQDGDGTASALAATHVYHGGYAGSFATTAPGGGTADFFASIGADRSVEIVYDLTGGGDTPVDSVLFWQYENDGGGLARAGNHARTIEIRINPEADGPTLFAGPPVTVSLLPVLDGDADATNDLGGVNTAQAYALGDLGGRYVQLSITDNYYGLQGMTNGGDRVGLGEIRFAGATLPVVVPGKTWLMVVHAHPDDEGIFFGGVLPYYARVLGLPTVLVNMTTGWLNGDGTRTADSYTREAELREAAVRYGLGGRPLFALFQQTDWNLSIDNSWDRWADYVTDGDDVAEGQRKSCRRLAELIRTYRPEVIATHDLRGEYGHPDHKALAYATAAAWDLAAGREAIIDDGVTPPVTVTPDGVAGAPWEAKKLYLHSYEQNRLFHDHWEAVSIDADADGAADSTPRQVANGALDAHVSQGRPHVATVYDPLANGGNSWDAHPSEWWGLYASTVGPDSAVDDFSVEGRLYAGWARGDFTEHLTVPPQVGCAVDVDALDFGAVEIGAASTLEFVLTNTGRDAISGTLELVGSDCDCYAIVPGTGSYDLAYGASHVVAVVFAPQPGSTGGDCVIDTGSPTCGVVPLSGGVTDIPDLEEGSRLSACPNPFNPQVEVAFALSREQRAQIAVYDLSGRRRAVLADRVFAAGDHALGWNGRDEQGGPVSSGVYLILLRTGTGEQIEKVMLVH
ncbi:MAG: PIG-L family deacetylase [bacterium]|nr:PIG-L family deacetylase [bacterium]